MKKRKIIFVLPLLILMSCMKPIKINIDDKGRKIVVNSIFTADSTIKIVLQRSNYILDNTHTYPVINDAKIDLFENNIKIETISSANQEGKYNFKHIVKEGKTYGIEIEKSGYDITKATSTVPLKTKLKKVDYEINTEKINFTVHFSDRANEKNYYKLSASMVMILNEGTENEFKNLRLLSIKSKDPAVQELKNINKFNNSWLLITDDVFDGTNYALTCNIKNEFKNIDNVVIEYYFVLNTISKDMYNYYLAYDKYQNSTEDPFAELVKVYNNIDNGFGIFAGESSSVYHFSIKIN